MIQSRGQKVEGFSHRRSSSRTRNSWKKKSDNIKEKEKAAAANCQSSKKKSSLNSIEIRINKTEDKSSKHAVVDKIHLTREVKFLLTTTYRTQPTIEVDTSNG